MFAVAAITGLIAKENVIATLAALAACISTGFTGATEEGVYEMTLMIAETGITLPALLSFIAFNLLTVPCVAAVATAKAELGESRLTQTLLFWLTTSYLVSAILYTVGTFWWTAFIWMAVAAVGGAAYSLWSKKKEKEKTGCGYACSGCSRSCACAAVKKS